MDQEKESTHKSGAEKHNEVPEKFLDRLKLMYTDVRAELRPSDWSFGIPDFTLSLLLFVTFFIVILEGPFFKFVASYFVYWYAWEALALFTIPSLIWIFEKRGPEDPRSIDVPRPWRVGLCLFFVILFFSTNPKSLLKVIYYAAPFLIARAIHFFFNQPVYRDFIKACRRLGFAVMFFFVLIFPFAICWQLIGLRLLELEPGSVVFLFGGIYFLFFGFVEALAWPMRRLLELDEEDKKHAF